MMRKKTVRVKLLVVEVEGDDPGHVGNVFNALFTNATRAILRGEAIDEKTERDGLKASVKVELG